MLSLGDQLGWFNGITGEQSKNLKIFQADPFDYHSILDALKGCSGLFYSFEPPRDYSAYDENMVEIEVRAAHNVVEACAQTETIEKVVFTSSAAAIIWRDDQLSSNSCTELDERHWSDINLCRKFKLWYALSKTLAEKTALALAMDRGLNMVCINGGLLMCPDQLSITNPYLKGAPEMYANGVLATVDLRFMVDAHICVYEGITTYGRYLCFNHVITSPEDAVNLAKLISPPSLSQPQSFEEPEVNGRIIQQRISNKKLNKVMVDFESGS
ncbi:OLC1v1031260C1 [Oldenlandia corymbosa var. corymbosa]|uniref:OLC1v1031260C1 n=1 Tax=Oldenlandia corymbosa var. corymbosa TaxID=529605 RepID=A0AAV1CJ05_OLDCO|nr:OLC1v1031260C1 [Oldenlandia corymbosa var. corymbosa]